MSRRPAQRSRAGCGPVASSSRPSPGLAALLFGERRLEHLDDRQLPELAASLEFAVRGQVSERTLARALNRLSQRDDRAEAARALRAWLTQRANERELLGRRRAA